MRTLVIGGAGQDGVLLSSHLRALGDEVTGIQRGDLDLSDATAVRAFLSRGFDEIYYLAAHHHSSQESTQARPEDLCRRSFDAHVHGVVSFLEAIRSLELPVRLAYAGSALMFGRCQTEFPDEETPLDPDCIYGISKTAGFRMCRFYREKFGVFSSGLILFNHESHLRESKFVVPKIIDAALAAEKGELGRLELGSLDARVDWGYAPDFVDAMVRVLRLDRPDDFVVATGESHSVRDVVEISFGHVGLDWRQFVFESAGLLGRQRPTLRGNAEKLHKATGWSPSRPFKNMITDILEARRAR
jgi:GDPmannose 4,6-dehydratase